MNFVRVLAVVLMVAGVLALALDKVQYATEIVLSGRPPIELILTLAVPRWICGGLFIAGLALYFSAKRKR